MPQYLSILLIITLLVFPALAQKIKLASQPAVISWNKFNLLSFDEKEKYLTSLRKILSEIKYEESRSKLKSHNPFTEFFFGNLAFANQRPSEVIIRERSDIDAQVAALKESGADATLISELLAKKTRLGHELRRALAAEAQGSVVEREDLPPILPSTDRCINAGHIMPYTRNSSGQLKCSDAPKEIQICGRKYSCENPAEALCNPLIFGFQGWNASPMMPLVARNNGLRVLDDNSMTLSVPVLGGPAETVKIYEKPICVPKGQNMTAACEEKANADRATRQQKFSMARMFLDFKKAEDKGKCKFGTGNKSLLNYWNEFATDVNAMCPENSQQSNCKSVLNRAKLLSTETLNDLAKTLPPDEERKSDSISESEREVFRKFKNIKGKK